MDTSPRVVSLALAQTKALVEPAREGVCVPFRWRVDPAGELHAFDRDHLWSVCSLVCASLTSETSESTRPRSVCPGCVERRPRPGRPVPLGAIDRRAHEETGVDR